MQSPYLGGKNHVSCFMLETGWLGGVSAENDLEVLLDSKLNVSQSVPWQQRPPAASQMAFRGSQPGTWGSWLLMSFSQHLRDPNQKAASAFGPPNTRRMSINWSCTRGGQPRWSGQVPEDLSHEERLQELGLFRLKKGHLWDDWTAASQYLFEGRYEEDGASFYSVAPDGRTRGKRYKLK